MLMWKNSAELVGQAGSLRPIGNRPLAALASSRVGRLPIGPQATKVRGWTE